MRIAPPSPVRDATQLEVRAVLNAWDPIGVHQLGVGWPEDEYDDLIQPIIDACTENPAGEELAADLYDVLTTDYGLSAPPGCVEAAALLLALLTPTPPSTPSR